MSGYTPTTGQVRAIYASDELGEYMDVAGEWFDRWLAETVRAAKAEAWDEGRSAGVDDMIAADLGVNRRNLPNPYREVSSVDQ